MLSPTRRSHRQRDQVCVVDLGSQTLRAALFACGLPGHPPEVVGVAAVPTRGLGAGAPVDLPALSASFGAVIEQLEHMADARVTRVVLVVSHSSLRVDAATGLASVQNSVVGPRDCRRAEEAARQRFARRRQRLVHEAVQAYRLDGRSYRDKPQALKGQRLEVDVQHISLSAATLANLGRAVLPNKLQIEAICSNVLAGAAAALSEDERAAGSVLFDIGAQSTTASIYVDGSLVAARCERGGGEQQTHALSRGLLVPLRNAEERKVGFAYAAKRMAPAAELVEVETIGLREARSLSRALLAEAIEPTVRSQLGRVATLVAEAGVAERLSGGVVLAGNGARLAGIAAFAEACLSVPVRVAKPSGLGGLAELLDQPGDCNLAGAAILWSRDELPSWQMPERKARARRGAQPRWLDLLA